MVWIEQRERAGGRLVARVTWRLGGARDGVRQVETFAIGTNAQNFARADGFKRMVEASGQRWPEGWVKGEGFVRPPEVADPLTPPPSFDSDDWVVRGRGLTLRSTDGPVACLELDLSSLPTVLF